MKTVKMQLDKKHFVTVEVEDGQALQIEEMNRELWRNTKRAIRHESQYSLDAMTEESGLDIVDPSPSVEERLIDEETSRERTERLHNAIAKLTPRQQEMVQMVYFEGKSQDEVAAFYGIAKSTMSEVMHRIYATLKKYLQKN
jgi:RNA polymerase sigma factor (sigma-70 family)